MGRGCAYKIEHFVDEHSMCVFIGSINTYEYYNTHECVNIEQSLQTQVHRHVL